MLGLQLRQKTLFRPEDHISDHEVLEFTKVSRPVVFLQAQGAIVGQGAELAGCSDSCKAAGNSRLDRGCLLFALGAMASGE
jgi:hypothetical protein